MIFFLALAVLCCLLLTTLGPVAGRLVGFKQALSEFKVRNPKGLQGLANAELNRDDLRKFAKTLI